MIRSLAAMLACAVACCLPAHAQTQSNIPYTSDSRGTHLADLYEPAGAGPFPAIVYVHGGSWRSGNKKDFRRFAQDLAGKGYVGLSIEYDLHPHSFPLSWQETRAAVRFVREHAAEYHVDPAKIVIAGTSAGGELAALTALVPEGPSAASGPEPGLAPGAVPVAAAIMLNSAYELNNGSYYVINRYVGGKCSQNPAPCREASPMNHVHAGAPPFFVGHGDHDHLVPYASAQLFVLALRNAGVPVTPFTAEGAGHMYWRKEKFYDADLKAVLDFLQSTLQTAPAR